MDKNKWSERLSIGRFTFLSIGWWIVHILLILLVFFLIRFI